MFLVDNSLSPTPPFENATVAEKYKKKCKSTLKMYELATHTYFPPFLQRNKTFVIFYLLPFRVKSLQNGINSHGKIRFIKKLIPIENEG